MDIRDKKLIEKLDNDFHQLSSQEGWQPQDIELMKDLQKLMYYMEVRCAMKENEEYQNDSYGNEIENSRYGMYGGYGNRYYDGGNMSGRGGYSRNGYGMNSNRGSYGNRPFSGRRYYDSEKENSMNDLRQMISMEQDPDKRSMLENIMHTLENDK